MTPKQLLPAGAKQTPGSDRWVWVKKGGHPDRTFKALRNRMRKAGFVFDASKPTGTPDGSNVGTDAVYQDAVGNVLRVSTNYGGTAADNRFRIEYQPAPKDEFPGRCPSRIGELRCVLDAGHDGLCLDGI